MSNLKTPSLNNKIKLELIEENNEDESSLTTCGIGSWRPKFLQRFATPIWFLVNMSIVGTIQGMTGPLFISAISTLEKRYAFDSKVTAIILIADNFSQMLISPLVGYLAVRYNRARLIGIGELILALSCFLTALPYFIYGPALHFIDSENPNSLWNTKSNINMLHSGVNGNGLQMCQLQSNISSDIIMKKGSCTEGTTIWMAVIILFIGSFFRGIGFTCYFVIGMAYVDDNVSRKNSPMFMSVMHSIRLIGPAAGFMLSAICLRFFENPFIDPGYGRSDPRFIGAWWLSFCVVGFLLFIAALPMLLFPLQFKNATVKASSLQDAMQNNGGSISAVKRFLKNPVVMMYTFGSIFRYIGIGGYIMFKTKYIESQFRRSSSSASFITGTTSIMPMAVGILLGGAMLTFFRPKPRFIVIYIFIVEGLSIFTFGTGMFIGCNPLNMAGSQATISSAHSLTSACNSACDCSNHVYTPFCGSDGVTTYFSPCHAGCSIYSAVNQTANNCSCFDGPATKGFCPVDKKECDSLFTYLLIILIGGITSSTARTANSLISFRTIDPMDKSFTIGMASTIMAVFAFIPYPIIFGTVIESTCLVWETKCGKTGNCWFYDQEKFRKYLHGTCVIFILIGSIFDFIIIFYSDRIKNFYGDEDDEPEDAKKEPKDIINLEMKSTKMSS